MSTTLISTRLSSQLSGNLANPLPLQTVSAPPVISFNSNWVNGVGVNQADQLWIDQRTLNPSTSENINVVTFAGSLDSVGGALALVRVKALAIQAVSGTVGTSGGVPGFSLAAEPGSIAVGGAGPGAWTPLFSGNSAAKATVPGGGNLFIVAPGPIGWNAGSTSGSLLTIANLNSTGSITYNIAVLGCSA